MQRIAALTPSLVIGALLLGLSLPGGHIDVSTAAQTSSTVAGEKRLNRSETETERASQLELVARARVSAVYDIEVVPPYGYALERGILRVLDIRDPAAVREVGSLELSRPRVRMALHHPYLYLTGFGQPMAVVDISNPTRPRWVGELDDFGGTMNDGFELAGAVAYLVRRATGEPLARNSTPLLFEVVDLGNAAHPSRLGSLDLGVRVSSVGGVGIARADGRVFVVVGGAAGASPQSRLIVVDTRDPASPRIEQTLLLPQGRQFVDVEVREDLVFLLQGSPEKGLVVFQMKSNGELELLGEAFDERLLIPIDLIVHRDVVYATFKGEIDMATFDISDPRAPKIVHTHSINDIWAAGLGMTLVQDRLYVAGDGGPAPIFDLSEPAAPRLLGRWEFRGGWVGDLVWEGQLMIAANIGGGVFIYDMSDPLSPRRMARYSPLTSNAPAAWQQNVVLAASGSMLVVAYTSIPAEVIDLSEPRSPQVLGSFTPRGLVHAIVLRAPYAILGYRGLAKGRTPDPWDSSSFSAKGGVEIIDLDDPSNPRPVAVLELDRPVTGMAMDGDYLLAVHSDGGMTVVDLENPSKPTVVSQLPGSEKTGAVQSFSRAAKIAFSGEGHLAYVISSPTFPGGNRYIGSGTLTVVDLREPAKPQILGKLELAFEPSNVLEPSIVVSGSYLIITAGDILIVDAANPADPRLKARQPVPSSFGDYAGLALNDQYLCLGMGEDGIFVYRLPLAVREATQGGL